MKAARGWWVMPLGAQALTIAVASRVGGWSSAAWALLGSLLGWAFVGWVLWRARRLR